MTKNGKIVLDDQSTYYISFGIGKNTTYDRFITEVNSCLLHNTFDKLKYIKCKTLVIGAEKDQILGVIGSKELADNIKDSKLYIYKDYSHGVYEQAKDFNKRVLEFLKGE